MGRDKMKRLFTLFAMFTMIGLIIPVVSIAVPGGSADADPRSLSKTWIVAADGSGDYTVIQDAIDSASDGDTIRIYSGIYYEKVIVNRRVDLIGNGSSNTIVDSTGADHQDDIAVTTSYVNLSGFGCRNGYTGHLFGGITVSGSYCRIFNNSCWNNHYGMILWSGNNHVFNNNMSNNNKNGIHLTSSSNNVIENNILMDSSETQGLYMEHSTDNYVANNTIHSNSKYGISLYQCQDVTIYNNTVTGSELFHGINVYDSTNTLVKSNTCQDNAGTGISARNSGFTNITGNNCSLNAQNGLGVYSSSDTVIRWNHLHGNEEGIHVEMDFTGSSAHKNWISGNIDFGINASGATGGSFNASYNWWGDYSGPYHPVSNPTGLANEVTDNVLFYPWFTGPFVNTPPVIGGEDVTSILEDDTYMTAYNASDEDGDVVIWYVETNASWLHWDAGSQVLSGTPNNTQVGVYYVLINITDGQGGYDQHEFDLTVINDPPVITTFDDPAIIEDTPYFVDYDSTDDAGGASWTLSTDCDFLTIGSSTGILSGLPSNDDVGEWWVNVSVDDGNGGVDYHNFTLSVLNMNDVPEVDGAPGIMLIDEDEIRIVDLNTWFRDIDGDQLYFRSEGTSNITAYIDLNGTMTLTPPANWSGTDSITVYARDRVDEISTVVSLEILPVNDAPYDVDIILEEIDYIENGSQPAFGIADDVDIPYGDELSFRWYSNISGYIGPGDFINLSIERGDHRITLNVSDSQGLWTTAYADIHVGFIPVNDTPDDDLPDDDTPDDNTADDDIPDDDTVDDDLPDDDTPEDDDTEPDGGNEEEEDDGLPYPLILGVIFLVILIALGVVVYMKTGRSGPVDEEE